jgi:carbon storage regulator CsrA
MLVLDRKVGEGVWVGEAFVVVSDVRRIRGGFAVKLAIDAPLEIHVLRDELLDGEKKPKRGNGVAEW